MPDHTETAAGLVKIITSGAVEHDDAIALLAQALRTAHASGELLGAKDMSDSMLKTFDNTLRDSQGRERLPGSDPVTGEYSTAHKLPDGQYTETEKK
jgi:hypothetical protein